MNVFHSACSNSNASIEVLSFIIDIAGKEIIYTKDAYGHNGLRLACNKGKDISVEVLTYLVREGGRDLVLNKGKYCKSTTVLHEELLNSARLEVVSMFIEVGGSEMLWDQDKYDWIPLHNCFSYYLAEPEDDDDNSMFDLDEDDEREIEIHTYFDFSDGTFELIMKESIKAKMAENLPSVDFSM